MTKNPNIVPGINLQLASTETALWREFNKSTVSPEDQDGNLINAYFIPIEDIQNVVLGNARALGYQPSGIRVYFALRDGECTPAQDNLHLLVVAVDEQGNDVYQYDPQNGQPTISLVYNATLPCPSVCGTPNPLNS